VIVDSAVRIAVLLPDALGTYSDHGNATVLAQRARWRGIPVEVCEVPAGADPPAQCDIYLLGGGEDAAQVLAAEWLGRHKALCRALSAGGATLAVCAGLQVLGEWMQDSRGCRVAGAGILDLTTSTGRRRAVGEVVTECVVPGVGALTGFENHAGRTRLGPGLRPLGRVVRGVGNGAGEGDGVRTDRVVGTYLHGPVLARNPALADAVLESVTRAGLPPLCLPDQVAVRRLRLDGHGTLPRLLGRRTSCAQNPISAARSVIARSK
jgi:CobQ-like glutamine amidotransferase family enzyme